MRDPTATAGERKDTRHARAGEDDEEEARGFVDAYDEIHVTLAINIFAVKYIYIRLQMSECVELGLKLGLVFYKTIHKIEAIFYHRIRNNYPLRFLRIDYCN